MYSKIILLISAIIMYAVSTHVKAHEMTPTYPELRPSYLQGVYSTTMEVFNTRKSVEYYEVEVFDEQFNAIPFAVKSKLLNVKYLSHVKFEVYVRSKDVARATYVCTTSRLKRDEGQNTVVATKICSKFTNSV